MKNEDQPLNPDRIEQIFLMATAPERHRVSAEKWNAHAARLGLFDFKKSKFFAMKGGKTPEDELLERISDAVAEELGGLAFDCIRDWSAWWAGTMRADDFLPIADDANIMIMNGTIATMLIPMMTRFIKKNRRKPFENP